VGRGRRAPPPARCARADRARRPARVPRAWSAEHHFREEAAHGSAPAVLLAAAAARTTSVRLGLAEVPVAADFGHPARLAGAVATLDLVSDGRVELATSEGTAGIELGGFGVDRERRRAAWEEGLDVLTRMWVEEPFAGWTGPGLAMPPRQVLPRPRQRPHPPLWLACSRREQVRLAAEKGLGALCLAPLDPDEAGCGPPSTRRSWRRSAACPRASGSTAASP
jgi:alkanesulfonate monooxygenase SsuD/methylene tetrahydromethanopterin reductase-like flavin-dependent oxidoreductase (luciferase family)